MVLSLAISAERRLELLIEAITDHAIIMLDGDGLVASWNKGARRLKGYSTSEIVGRHFSCFCTEEDRANGEPERALRTAAEQGKYDKEGWRVRKDGSRFWASVVIEPIYETDGTLLGFAKITRDITERRQAQEALERARAALLQSQRMDAIGQLTGGIAHDFNNLLTVIINSLQLILRPPSDAQRIYRLVTAAQQAAERGAKLTDHLLSFARRQHLQPKIRNVNTLLGECEVVLRRTCGENVEMDLNLASTLPLIDIDGAQLEGALLNLIANARDAMPKGGKLRIDTGAVTVAADAAELFGVAPGRYVAVSVSDTGDGMPPEVKARAFEPFYTTKDIGQGSGLGLSQVHGFVTQSGGYVDLDSKSGNGTTVTMYFPAIPEPEATEPVNDNRCVRAATTETVLLVEDDPDLLDLSAEMLHSLGYKVLAAADGASALNVLRSGRKVDILFSDVLMPRGMNGIDLARQARQLRPHLRVLLSSGYVAAAATRQGSAGEFAFMAKPYRLADLGEALQSLKAG